MPAIKAVANQNGTISPSGEVQVGPGKEQKFLITPSSPRYVVDVTVDGSPIGAVNEYTFSNVTVDHDINATFRKKTQKDCKKDEKDGIMRVLGWEMSEQDPISVAFTPCSDVLLSLINTTTDDEVAKHFKEYFKFGSHLVFPTVPSLDQDLNACLQGIQPIVSIIPAINIILTEITAREQESALASMLKDLIIQHGMKLVEDLIIRSFPPERCLPGSCVTIYGTRRYNEPLRRLFIADLVWSFFFDRMGIFKILGVIMDDYASKGKFPISVKDRHKAIVLEAMVRQTKMGLSSTVRDRESSYRRSLGWTTDAGRKLGLDTMVNSAFSNLFHKFIQTALEYYKDKRLAQAIQAQAGTGKVSVATLISIGDTITVLKEAFSAFEYGRNYQNTLNGIVWAIAGMSLVRDMRTTLGIPSDFSRIDQYLPAAYDLLVLGRPITPSEANRYIIHKECAEDGRDMLLDIQVLDPNNRDGLEAWLDKVEDKVEGYRTAYRTLTGVDLGLSGTPKIEQQV